MHSDAVVKPRVPGDICHQQLRAVEIDRITNENECQIGQLVSENSYNIAGDVDKVSPMIRGILNAIQSGM